MNIDNSWYIKPFGIPEHDSAGGVVVRTEKGKIFLAATHEIDTDGLVLPKGHVEIGETFTEAAVREIGEETGITKLTQVSALDTKERLDYPKKAWKKTHYFLFTTTQKNGKPSDPRHDGIVWLELSEYQKYFWPEQRELIKENMSKIQNCIAI